MLREQPTLQQGEFSSTGVQEAYRELHKGIDNLDLHIQDLVRRHQGEFMVAYRNHLLKVKDQLAMLKRKSEEQERNAVGGTKVDKLEKQVALFREEALKVYNKLDERTKESEQHRMRLLEALELNSKYEADIKELSRRLKESEVRNKEASLNLLDLLQEERQREREKALEERQIPDQKEIRSYSKKPSVLLNQTNSSILQVLNRHFPDSPSPHKDSALSSINSIIKERQQQLTERWSTLRQKQLLGQSLNQSTSESQLKMWFLDCVKTVKKEIIKRNSNTEQLKREVRKMGNIEEFLRIDKLRLLELFVGDESLMTTIYNKLFPGRREEIQQYLTKSNQKDMVASEVEENEFTEHLEEIESPKQVVPKSKPKPKKELIRNRVIVKNGKLILN